MNSQSWEEFGLPFVTTRQYLPARLLTFEEIEVKLFRAFPVNLMATREGLLNDCLALNSLKKRRMGYGARNPILQMATRKLDVFHFNHAITAILATGLWTWVAARIVGSLT